MSEREDLEAFEAAVVATECALPLEIFYASEKVVVYRNEQTRDAWAIWKAALRYERERAREKSC